MKIPQAFIGLTAMMLGLVFGVAGQSARPMAPNIVVPQTGMVPLGSTTGVQVSQVKATVAIDGPVSRTTLEIHLTNPGTRDQEAELLLPVPTGAVVQAFSFGGQGVGASAELLPHAEARRIYNDIVARSRDPALLEFAGHRLVRSSVFPVAAQGAQWVRIRYEALLTREGNRMDYVLPRSESLSYQIPWEVSVEIESDEDLATLYSPSHELTIERQEARRVTLRLAEREQRTPGSFRLSMIHQDGAVSASLINFPDSRIGGGYFLLLAGIPEKVAAGSQVPQKREVSLVLDRSGSMNGEKLIQVREAALQLLSGLDPGEYFNLIVYNEGVDQFSEAPVEKTADSMKAARAYLEGINARGGTNIHDSLQAALQQKPVVGALPMVLFLTDGLPTIGQRTETAIRDMVARENVHHRRVFTFGVGADVNSPLLGAIATETRALPTFVVPGEDVELKVAQVFDRLQGPVLSAPVLRFDQRRVHDVLPAPLPDLFKGDQLVVLGQYIGTEPLAFTLAGQHFRAPATFTFDFSLRKSTAENAYVPRLWASRKIGVLLEAIRTSGHANRERAAADPKLKELIDEVVRLSTEFGILTEYTAFLARDGAALTREANISETRDNVQQRNDARSGLGAINQERNVKALKSQRVLNISNRSALFDMTHESLSLKGVESGRGGRGFGVGGATVRFGTGQQVGVQQVNDLAFYWNGTQWIDSRLTNKEKAPVAAKEIQFGSPAFFELLQRQIKKNRQGSIALRGDILMEVDGENIRIKGP